MSQSIEVIVEQVDATTSRGSARSHEVLVDRPKEKGGADRGPLGGELFLIGLGGCFMSNLLAADHARTAELKGARVAVSGTIASNPSRFASITMRISASASDPEIVRKLVTIAANGCIVTNTLRDTVPLTLIVEDAPSPVRGDDDSRTRVNSTP